MFPLMASHLYILYEAHTSYINSSIHSEEGIMLSNVSFVGLSDCNNYLKKTFFSFLLQVLLTNAEQTVDQ